MNKMPKRRKGRYKRQRSINTLKRKGDKNNKRLFQEIVRSSLGTSSSFSERKRQERQVKQCNRKGIASIGAIAKRYWNQSKSALGSTFSSSTIRCIYVLKFLSYISSSFIFITTSFLKSSLIFKFIFSIFNSSFLFVFSIKLFFLIIFETLPYNFGLFFSSIKFLLILSALDFISKILLFRFYSYYLASKDLKRNFLFKTS